MGLESLPDHIALGKITELNHPNRNSNQIIETSTRAMLASHPFEVNMIISEKKCTNPNNISILGKETTHIINHGREMLELDGSRHNKNYQWKQKTRKVDRKLLVETRHGNRNNRNVNQLHHHRLPCSKGNDAEYDTNHAISSISTAIEVFLLALTLIIELGLYILVRHHMNLKFLGNLVINY